MVTYHECTCGDYNEGCITCSSNKEFDKGKETGIYEVLEKINNNYIKELDKQMFVYGNSISSFLDRGMIKEAKKCLYKWLDEYTKFKKQFINIENSKK